MMLPVIHFFGISLPSYYTMMGIGFLVMVWMMQKRKSIFSLSSLQAAGFTVLLLLTGILGCKLLFILENWESTFENGASIGGFSFFGAVFLIPLLMPQCGRLFRMNLAQSLNASAPCVCAMLGTVRVGCFLNDCCGGWTTAHGFTWPTQAIESIGDLFILIWLLDQEKKGKQALYPKYMLTYGVLRFLIEFLRDTSKDWLHLSHGQWFSVFSVIVAVYVLLKRRTSS